MIATRYRYLANAVTLHLDPGKCDGCRLCVEVCPHAVFVIDNKCARIVDRDACMECGACAQNCEPGAITVQAGVGCAQAIIHGVLTGSDPGCDCDNSRSPCCG